ncbi:hypothetical protein M595_0783 [Lyngbya aestuarii BL J]|uniref:Uncharacterized protein n=1 Tax=Lyngbya aestuarii BL J TaxID=1348334 RepID=U7QQ68_9CYAN|nr:hypothetical protein M595_0783 [Lyngbya aestuarii BL J]
MLKSIISEFSTLFEFWMLNIPSDQGFRELTPQIGRFSSKIYCHHF